MSVGIAIALLMIGASIVQCVAVATFAIARRQPRLKWLVVNCLSGAGYSFGCLLSASESLPSFAHWCSGPIGYSMAAVYFASAVRFLELSFKIRRSNAAGVLQSCLFGMSILCWIPGAVFGSSGQVRSWAFGGTAYSFPESTSLIWLAGLAMFCGLGHFLYVLKQCPLAFQVAGGVFASFAAIDVLVCLGALEWTWFAAFGSFVFLTVVTQREASSWADEAIELLELRQDLEAKVEQRSAELAQSVENLNKHNHLVSLGQLAASIGHEINNPLAYVIANLELKSKRSEDFDEAVENALEGADRIARIVKELRTLSRADDSSTFDAVDLGEATQTAAKTLRHLLSGNKQLDVDCEPDCFVYGNRYRLIQLMMNLISNAIAALPEDFGFGNVTVRVSSREGEVSASVQDEGAGIPEDVQARLFEPFFTTRASGLGLGLSISKMIVEETQGDLQFSSEPNKGTIFCVKFPALEGEELPLHTTLEGTGKYLRRTAR